MNKQIGTPADGHCAWVHRGQRPRGVAPISDLGGTYNTRLQSIFNYYAIVAFVVALKEKKKEKISNLFWCACATSPKPKPVCHEKTHSNELHTSGRDGTSAIQLNCRRLTKAGVVVAILVLSEGQWFRVGTLWCRRTGKLSNC